MWSRPPPWQCRTPGGPVICDRIRPVTALSTSAAKFHGQQWCEVADIRANVNESGGVDRWQVEVKVAFEVD